MLGKQDIDPPPHSFPPFEHLFYFYFFPLFLFSPTFIVPADVHVGGEVVEYLVGGGELPNPVLRRQHRLLTSLCRQQAHPQRFFFCISKFFFKDFYILK